MVFNRYTIEPIPGTRSFRVVGHWGLTRVLLGAVASLREAFRRQPDAELVDPSGDPFATRALRSKFTRKFQRLL